MSPPGQTCSLKRTREAQVFKEVLRRPPEPGQGMMLGSYDRVMEFERAAADIGFKLMNHTHRAIRLFSGGHLGRRLMGMQALELHTTGRKSGQRRSVMLTAPIHDDTRTMLIASKGGDDRDPDWYLNLTANPDVEITIEGKTTPMRARTASADEKAALWPAIVATYKGYAGYQKRTDRDIPVVICEPR